MAAHEWVEDGHRLVFRMVSELRLGPTAVLMIECPRDGKCHPDGDSGPDVWCPPREEWFNAGTEAITGFEGDLPLPAVIKWRWPSIEDDPLEIVPASPSHLPEGGDHA